MISSLPMIILSVMTLMISRFSSGGIVCQRLWRLLAWVAISSADSPANDSGEPAEYCGSRLGDFLGAHGITLLAGERTF